MNYNNFHAGSVHYVGSQWRQTIAILSLLCCRPVIFAVLEEDLYQFLNSDIRYVKQSVHTVTNWITGQVSSLGGSLAVREPTNFSTS